ncbi:PD-(D/E)XK nuclease family protein, partial [Salinimicrobium sp. CDJ15-91]|nr:PD-(D/E)XK nuclease family protein [Salinimicrobium oceani]
FLKDEQHDVSLFLRQYLKSWPYYQEKPLNIVSNSYSGSKNISMVGVPKNIGQAKYMGELLAGLSPAELQQTAVVLGDESLLLPVLNSLPPNVEEVNITMGFALKNAPATFFFEQLLQMHSTPGDGTRYYKDLMLILSHPLIQKITGGYSHRLMEKLRKENLVYVSREETMAGIPENIKRLFEICFG